MSNRERNHGDDFVSNLHSFLEDDSRESKEEKLDELRNAGIDPDEEVSWVNRFVAEHSESQCEKTCRLSEAVRST